jgi:hypothetical protein
MFALPRAKFSRSPIYTILQWMRNRSRDFTLNQLQASVEKAVKRIANDSGLSPADLRALVSLGPNATVLLERRIVALELDPGEVSEIAPNTFRDLQRVCSFCESHGRCLRDLARNPADTAWKDYCPNVDKLMALHRWPWASRGAI